MLQAAQTGTGVAANVNAETSYTLDDDGSSAGPGVVPSRAHPYAVSVRGETALHVACEHGFELAALVLVEAGADCNARKHVQTFDGLEVAERAFAPDDAAGWRRGLERLVGPQEARRLAKARKRCSQLLRYSRQPANCSAEQRERVARADAISLLAGGSGDPEVDTAVHNAMLASMEAARLEPYGTLVNAARLRLGAQMTERLVVLVQARHHHGEWLLSNLVSS